MPWGSSRRLQGHGQGLPAPALLLCKPCSNPPDPPTCSGAFQTLSREKRDRCERVLPQSCSRAAQILNLGVQHAAQPRSSSSVWVWLPSQGFQTGSSVLLRAGGVPGRGEPAVVPVPRPLSQFPQCPVDVLLEPGTPLTAAGGAGPLQRARHHEFRCLPVLGALPTAQTTSHFHFPRVSAIPLGQQISFVPGREGAALAFAVSSPPVLAGAVPLGLSPTRGALHPPSSSRAG